MRRLHQVTAGWSSHLARSAMAAVPGGRYHHASRSDEAGTRERHAADSLRRDGLALLDPVLDDERVASLTEFARRAPASARFTDGSFHTGSYEETRDRAAVVFVDGRFGWSRPEVQHALSDPYMWAVARHYFGMLPVVHPPRLYWTCATDAQIDEQTAVNLARNYHWDYDGVGNLRFMIYLTDVDDRSAPIEIVKGSHRAGALGTRELRHADSGEARPEALRALGLDRGTSITGQAGTTFVTDSYVLHRATAAATHDRLMMLIPMQAGSFAGYYHRPRRVPARDERFAAALAADRPELDLFIGGDPDEKVVTFADEEPMGHAV